MTDPYDNRATVTLGGLEVTLVASKLAERIYGDRFRHDIDALGESNAYHAQEVAVTDEDGKPVLSDDGKPRTRQVMMEYGYTGQLKLDIAISAQSNIGATAEITQQVVAATWAMAKAAGSTSESYDRWLVWWWSLPSNSADDLALFEAVCVDLAERAFFRDYGRHARAQKPDETEGA